MTTYLIDKPGNYPDDGGERIDRTEGTMSAQTITAIPAARIAERILAALG